MKHWNSAPRSLHWLKGISAQRKRRSLNAVYKAQHSLITRQTVLRCFQVSKSHWASMDLQVKHHNSNSIRKHHLQDPKLGMQCTVLINKLPRKIENLYKAPRKRSPEKVKKVPIKGRRRLCRIEAQSSDEEAEEETKEYDQGSATNQSEKIAERDLNSQVSPNMLNGKTSLRFVTEKISFAKEWKITKTTTNEYDAKTNRITSKTITNVEILDDIEVVTLSSDEEDEKEPLGIPPVQVTKKNSTIEDEKNLQCSIETGSVANSSSDNQFFPNSSCESLNETDTEEEEDQKIAASKMTSNANEKKLQAILASDRFKSKPKTTLLTQPRALPQHQYAKRLATGGESCVPQRRIVEKPTRQRKAKKPMLSSLRKEVSTPYMRSFNKCNREALARSSSCPPAPAPPTKVPLLEQSSGLPKMHKSSAPGPVKAKNTMKSRADLLAEDFVGKDQAIVGDKKRAFPSSNTMSCEILAKKAKLINDTAYNSTKSIAVIDTEDKEAGINLASKRKTSYQPLSKEGSKRIPPIKGKMGNTSHTSQETSGNRSDNDTGLQSTSGRGKKLHQEATVPTVPLSGCIQEPNKEASSASVNALKLIDSGSKEFHHATILDAVGLKRIGILKYTGSCGGSTIGKKVRFAEKNQIRIIESRSKKKSRSPHKVSNYRRLRSLSTTT